MHKVKRPAGKLWRPLFIISLGVSLSLLDGSFSAAERKDSKVAEVGVKQNMSQNPAGPDTGLAALQVSFKLSPRLMGGTYGGDRWVSPHTYTTIESGGKAIVEVRVDGVDRKGQLLPITPEWIPADPGMLTVTPAQGQTVKITVQHAGQTTLKVNAQSISKTLSVKADPVYQGKAIKIDISQ